MMIQRRVVRSVRTNMLSSRWFKKSTESFTKVPLFGAVSYLRMVISPFCVIFAIVWVVYRDAPYAWIGQDILHTKLTSSRILFMLRISTSMNIICHQPGLNFCDTCKRLAFHGKT